MTDFAKYVCTGLFCLLTTPALQAQYTVGATGLLNTPSADMQSEGTFMAGANYLPEEMTPSYWDYNSGNYFVNLTFFPFLELGYRNTFIRGDFKKGLKWQQDRSLTARLRVLEERRWWPSVVFGSNDLFTTRNLNIFKPSGNRFYSSVYAVATKHLDLGGNDLSLTAGGYIPFDKGSEFKGPFGGVSFSPAFCRSLSLIAEYDSKGVNLGASARLFGHFELYALCYDMRTVSGGVRYRLTPDMNLTSQPAFNWNGRAELLIYPQLTLNNAWLDKLYGTAINLAPALQLSLWKGASFIGQAILPIWNNMGGQYDYIRAGVISLNQSVHLSDRFYGRLSVGNFTNSRMGTDLLMRFATPDTRWLFGVRGGVTGASTFYGGEWRLSTWKRVSGEVMARYRIPSWKMDVKLAGHRFVYGDYGVRMDCRRRFGHALAGVYAMVTGGMVNGGFHFAIPLPQWGRNRNFRVALPDYYQMTYSAQSGNKYAKRNLGESYQTHPGEGGIVDYDYNWFVAD